MSILTAFSLSLNNLLTKKARTILTSFAGSIGIIGIALILSLSTGFQNYIDQIQEDTLTSYPLTITSETADTTSMLLSMVSESDEETKGDIVKESQIITDMFTKIGTNDLTSFKKYLEDNSNKVNNMVSLVRFGYSVTPLIYTKNNEKGITQLNPSDLMTSLSGGMVDSSSAVMSAGVTMSVFNEMIDDKDTLQAQYDVLAGQWPQNYDEVILVLPEANAMPDLLVYSLGLRDSKELEDMIAKIMKGEKIENKNKALELSYEELMNLPLKLIDATDTYKYNKKYKVYEDMTEDKEFMKKAYENAKDLKIVGIVTAKEGSNASTLTPGVAYTKDLTEYVINKASESEIVKKQLKNEDINVFSNKKFDDDSKEAGLDFQDMISIDTKLLSEAFGGNVNQDDISKMTEGYMSEISSAITTDTSKAQKAFIDTLSTLTTNLLNDYISKNATAGIATITLGDVDKVVNEFMSQDTSKTIFLNLEKEYTIPQNTFGTMYSQTIKGFLTGYITMTATDKTNPTAILVSDAVPTIVTALTSQEEIITTSKTIAASMVEATMQKTILTKVGELTGKLMQTMSSAFKVDQNKIAAAFKFNLGEDELKRLFETMSNSAAVQTAETNLITLGYQNINEPTSISFYFKNFDSKEAFIDFLDDYNKKMEEENEEKVIKYTDITGILMSSVKVIVDSVSYVLIAFVSISLVVSSIMIGIITYISVLERTKEIGVLRAIGASKKNISSIFNAETFIVGLFAGILGIVVTLILLVPINKLIHTLTGNLGITAVLPTTAAIVLVILSVVLTLIGGLIPSKQAAKKDPVLALRSE